MGEQPRTIYSQRIGQQAFGVSPIDSDLLQ
jgi:hypothetical protein